MPRRLKSSRSTLPPFKVVVVYDGFADLIRVHEIWSRLLGRFRDEIHIVSCAWNFSLLQDQDLRQRAARHTAEADLIVFSASGKNEPPHHIRLWIEGWLPWKNGDAALVAALDQELPVRALPLHSYLRQAAKKSGMDFFCNSTQGGGVKNSLPTNQLLHGHRVRGRLA